MSVMPRDHEWTVADLAHTPDDGLRYELVDGVPVLRGAVAWLACELDGELAGGDHTILLGRPLEAGTDPAARPLVFYGGGFHAGTFD